MNLRSQRELAAKILKVGVKKVFIDPERKEEISKAITRDDVRALIKDGSVSVRDYRGTSRSRARKTASQKGKGRRKGGGSKKGKKKSRTPKKEAWIRKVRSLRDELRKLRKEGKVKDEDYRKLYSQIKGNLFQSRRHLREQLIKE